MQNVMEAVQISLHDPQNLRIPGQNYYRTFTRPFFSPPKYQKEKKRSSNARLSNERVRLQNIFTTCAIN